MYPNGLHWFEMVRSSDWWQSQMPISMEALGRSMGYSKKYVYRTLNNASETAKMDLNNRIEKFIPDIESRKLCYPKGCEGVVKKGTDRPPAFMWLDPQPVTIPRLGMAWSLWAQCQSCRGNQFLPILIDTKEHYACYHCLHPTQYRSIGATPVNRSLIHEALKQYY